MNDRSRRVSRRRLCGLSVAAALIASAIAPAADSAEDGRSLMARIYQQDRSHDVLIQASFEVFDTSGHMLRKRFSYRRTGPLDGRKALVSFTDPPDIRGVTLLSITQAGKPDQQYIYIPATRRVRSVVAQQRSAPFIGTDFTFEDIEEKSLDDFNYRLLGAQVLLDGHKTFQVEATPVSASASQYKVVRYWLAQDVPVILQAELYGLQGSLVRVMHATGLRQISGIWGARRTEMRSVQTGTRTVLTVEEAKFDTGLDSRLFTPEALEAGSDATAPP